CVQQAPNFLSCFPTADSSSACLLACSRDGWPGAEVETVTRRSPSMVNVLGCIDEASLMNEDSNATLPLFLSSQKVKSRFLAHSVTLLSFSRPGFSSED
ncbi:hypothetical protein D6C99_00589, partial [Aureobasidium pullulans]